MTTFKSAGEGPERHSRCQGRDAGNKEALAATQKTTDVDFLCKQLELLHKKKIVLLEQENLLLKGQAPGENCLLRYLLLSLSWVACTLVLHVMFVNSANRISLANCKPHWPGQCRLSAFSVGWKFAVTC